MRQERNIWEEVGKSISETEQENREESSNYSDSNNIHETLTDVVNRLTRLNTVTEQIEEDLRVTRNSFYQLQRNSDREEENFQSNLKGILRSKIYLQATLNQQESSIQKFDNDSR